jgi:hypothetical protein
MAWPVISASTASAVHVTNWPSSGGRGVFQHQAENNMTADKRVDDTARCKGDISDEILLKISKEIVIKFIEMGRVTPATFDASFKDIHTTIRDTVKRG